MEWVEGDVLAHRYHEKVILSCTLLGMGSVLVFTEWVGFEKFDASSIGRVNSVERVHYGNFVFCTVCYTWIGKSHYYVAES